jgi:hypothetical protein
MIYLSSKARIAYIGFYFVQDPRSKVCRVQGMEQAVSEVFQIQVKSPDQRYGSGVQQVVRNRESVKRAENQSQVT